MLPQQSPAVKRTELKIANLQDENFGEIEVAGVTTVVIAMAATAVTVDVESGTVQHQ